jgi:hypothetical protein
LAGLALGTSVLAGALLSSGSLLSGPGGNSPWSQVSQAASRPPALGPAIVIPDGPARIESVKPAGLALAVSSGAVRGSRTESGSAFAIEPIASERGEYRLRTATGSPGSCVAAEGERLALRRCDDGSAAQAFVFAPVGTDGRGRQLFNLVTPDGSSVELDTKGGVSVHARSQSRFGSRWILSGRGKDAR